MMLTAMEFATNLKSQDARMPLHAVTMRTLPMKTVLVNMLTKAMTAMATALKTWTETVFVTSSKLQVVKTKQLVTTLRMRQMTTAPASMQKLAMIAMVFA